jgi:phosphoribosylamine--glycine ligase
MIVSLPKQWKKVVFLETLQPICSKADGFSRWKGVLIIQAEAKEELRNMLVGQKFGAASQR